MCALCGTLTYDKRLAFFGRASEEGTRGCGKREWGTCRERGDFFKGVLIMCLAGEGQVEGGEEGAGVFVCLDWEVRSMMIMGFRTRDARSLINGHWQE
ncbi:hypothetical protein Syun_003102 [Stephania yunnanensis]|uniref:Uncharacterized protein n=1 Tax=Stephania yunnanensis TaxID=152371 RepID=A0AAP0L1L7_9MAGN